MMNDAPNCRGSFALGGACGFCPKCREQQARYAAGQKVNAALNTPTSALREIRDLQAENARLKEYAIEATNALTGLTVGGSEFFADEGLGFFKADIPACVAHIRWRFETARKLGEAKGRASQRSENQRLKALIGEYLCLVEEYEGSDFLSLVSKSEERELRSYKDAFRAALKQET
ncbi:hypothetical protein [Tritonibacter scottomollicae]|uniref:hypothetical protein n=1 Tax=Tritonibacter scottomollicae TaxID=483013 RepID=UPI003AA8EAE6